MDRLNLIKNQLKKDTTHIIKYIDSAYDYLNFDEFLTEDERKLRLRLRNFMEKSLPSLNQHYEKQEFPFTVLTEFLKEFPGLIGMNIKGFGSANISIWMGVTVLMEISRVDASFFTFFMIHGGKLNMNVIYNYGSDEQKNYYLPKMIKGDIFSSFCLSESDYGSDATSIKTTVEEDKEGNFILNGTKSWVGNANLTGVLIVWAKNIKSKQIEGFLVNTNLPGISSSRMVNKLSMRSVHHSNIIFENVKIKNTDRLPKAKNFQDSVSQSLLFSRLGVSWGSVGVCIGAYDAVIKYCSNRMQFGRKLSSFQLVQDKLTKIMGNIQAMMFYCRRITELYIKNKATLGSIGMLKAWCTSKARENVSMARDLMGGNGILLEYNVMKHFVDVEGLFTYEGTYDINMLVAGKELTGINSIR